MTTHDLHATLSKLSARRPLFHSEADFQHELALELNRAGGICRLEVPVDVLIKGTPVRVEVDIMVRNPESGAITAIELKYVKSALSVMHENEKFSLSSGSPTNLSRFDCLADLERVAAIVAAERAKRGFTVFLTNLEEAWSRDVSHAPIKAQAFSLHEGRELVAGDSLDWTLPQPSVGSVSAKRLDPYAPILIPQTQTCSWNDYSKLPVETNGEFRYLLLESVE